MKARTGIQPWRLIAAAVLVLLSGCYDAPERTPVAICEGVDAKLLPPRVRRLTDEELARSLSDLVGEPVTLSLSRDPLVDGFDDNATALVVSGPKLDDYVAVAGAWAPKIAASATCEVGESASACLARHADRLARRLYGRPLEGDERDRLVALGDATSVAKAMLLSPFTLYRTEIGADDPATASVRLSRMETASALSFFVTGARPTDELQAAAERGELDSGEGRAQWARTLLDTPYARVHLRRFVHQWLGIRDFRAVRKDPDLFPEWDVELKTSMISELDRFIDGVVFDDRGTFAELFARARAYPDPRLAALYGDELLEAPNAELGSAVDERRRRGLLSLPIFLSMHATREGTNPVDRGLFVRSRIFCQSFGAPPKAALDRPIDFRDEKLTTREKFDVHSRDPACAACHSSIDPVGFGFESFDSIGRFRTEEHGKPVDGRGALDATDVNGSFDGPAALSAKVAKSANARVCFAQQLERFAMGRREESECEVGDVAQTLERGAVLDAIAAMVARDRFVQRSRP